MRIGRVELGPGAIILIILLMAGLLHLGLRQFGFDAVQSIRNGFKADKSFGTDSDSSDSTNSPTPATTARKVRLKGSSAINDKLGKDLAQDFMARHEGVSVLVESKGTSSGLEGLLSGEADIAAASRPANERERTRAQEARFDLESPESEHVIGFDAIALIVHPNNPISKLTKRQAAGIFSGAIKDWRELGGGGGPIKLIGRPKELGAYEIVQDAILGKGNAFAPFAEEIRENIRAAAAVARDPNAIGFVALGGIGGAKALEIAASEDSRFVAPSEISIRDRSYLLTRNLYLYTRNRPEGMTRDFIEFALQDGQDLVAQAGFVNLKLAIVRGNAPGGGAGEKLTTDIRFRSGNTEVNSLAIYDLKQALDRFCGRSGVVRLVGYSDTQGGKAVNDGLSLKRAQSVENLLKLQCPTLKTETIGQGDQNPVGDNATEEGRLLNRRVELWFIGK